MENTQTISCEIQIIRGRNIEQSSLGKSNLFVRCYLPAGNNQRVQLNSQEISSSSKCDSNLFWDDSFSLDCMGTQDSINILKQGTVVFELRSRKYFPVFGKNISGSQLLGRAEIPWKRVFESREMEIEEWAIFMATSKSNKRVNNEDVKPPAVKIAMKVKVKETTKVKKNNRSWDESCACKGYCGCNGCNIFSPQDYEIFALGAALD
ncbi:PREDICTED: uncharacterized protein LOC109216315 [Nicotiana attenuata]|uniref:C2 domain-containing protein n=1 Tax=Nicotiana attenuata TaxID=49451 RepID=A0A1J6JEQ8_NICAT|nr:PREDICTED: uncharacterized protein LOC109216315 [Nicotiana attenuata]OIT05537.1 hypothetical protein A4A49_32612 [Nicotiana attenuata]